MILVFGKSLEAYDKSIRQSQFGTAINLLTIQWEEHSDLNLENTFVLC